jgi:hypothetical protein
MRKRGFLSILTVALVLALSACTTVVAQPTMDSSAIGTIVALNVQLTQSAATINAIQSAPTATIQPTAQATPTATLTPEPSITPTLNGVWITALQNTNCRQGPQTVWPIILTLSQGTQAQAIGTSPDGNYTFLRVLDTSVHYCWAWNQSISFSGNTAALAKLTPLPTVTPSITPTPAANFTLSYDSLSSCSGSYFLRVLVTNTGYLTWKSIKMVVTDNTAASTVTYSSDMFNGYSGCSIDQQQSDLTNGEYGIVTNYNPGQFSYNPAGHALLVTVSLYSDDGLSGTVITKTLAVTP